jgi:hypothetical protein
MSRIELADHLRNNFSDHKPVFFESVDSAAPVETSAPEAEAAAAAAAAVPEAVDPAVAQAPLGADEYATELELAARASAKEEITADVL